MSLSLQAFGFTMIKLFLPILLLTKGIPIEHVALYFVFWGAIQVPLHPIIVWLVHIIGVKHCLALSYIASTFSFFLLAISDTSVPMILGVLASSALGQSLYWDSRHMHSASVLPKKSTGKSVSAIFVLVLIATALGPLIGGVITQQFGFKTTLVVSSAIILVAVIPLLMSKDNYFVIKRKRRSKPTPRRHLLANAAMVFDGGSSESLWPLFIFLLIGSMSSLGMIISLGLILTILITTFVGRYTDKGYGKSFVLGASLGRSITHTLRVSVTTIFGAIVVNVIGEIASSFKVTPYTSYYYKHARHYGIQRYVQNMQIVSSMSHMSYWAIFYICLQVLEPRLALVVVFIIAALMAPLHFLITKPR